MSPEQSIGKDTRCTESASTLGARSSSSTYSMIFETARPRTSGMALSRPVSRPRPRARPQTSARDSDDALLGINHADDSFKSNFSWQDGETSLASNVQDNLLEEVYRLQTALDAACNKYAMSVTQLDLLQHDYNEAQKTIELQDTARRELKADIQIQSREQEQQMNELENQLSILQSLLDDALRAKQKESETVALQIQEIQFNEECRYQLEGDIRELKSTLMEKAGELLASRVRHAQDETLLRKSREAFETHLKLCKVVQERNVTSEEGLLTDQQYAADKRESIVSNLGSEISSQACPQSRISIESRRSCESVITLNSIATPSLEQDALDWIRITDVSSFDESGIEVPSRCLQEELRSIGSAETQLPAKPDTCSLSSIPSIRVRAATRADEDRPSGDILADKPRKFEVETITPSFITAECKSSVSRFVQTEGDHAHCVSATSMDLIEAQHKNELRDLHNKLRKDTEQFRQSIDDLEADLHSLRLQRDFRHRNISRIPPRTSHLFEVKDRFGNTEVKFQRVVQASETPCAVNEWPARDLPRFSGSLSSTKSFNDHERTEVVTDYCSENTALLASARTSLSGDVHSASLIHLPSCQSISIPARRDSLFNPSFLDLQLHPLDVMEVSAISRTIDSSHHVWQHKQKKPCVFGDNGALNANQFRLLLEPPDSEGEDFTQLKSPRSTGTGLSRETESSDGSLQIRAAQPTAAEILGQKLTRTLIGVEMYKHIRQTRAMNKWGSSRRKADDPIQRHRRYVVLRPQDGTICWSSSRPAGKVLGFKKCHIIEIHDVEDSTPPPPGLTLHTRSLLIISDRQSLRFTATSAEIHRDWFDVIQHVVNERKSNVGSTAIAGTSQTQRGKTRPLLPLPRPIESRAATARPKPIMRNRPSMPDITNKHFPAIPLPHNSVRPSSADTYKAESCFGHTSPDHPLLATMEPTSISTFLTPLPVGRKRSQEIQQRVLAAFAV